MHFRYETTRNEDRAGDYQRRARKTAVISSRAQLIEVCTEASLQPIFQFYLVFQGPQFNRLKHLSTRVK